jgi:LysR family transcriptional regulator, transcriptional activator of nhaA
MSRLNYHHLRYFWAVAKEGNLTRAAAQLHVSQSALSTQIKQLEDQLGQVLFTRAGRALELTEAGRVALNYADTIFDTGNELSSLMRDGKRIVSVAPGAKRERQVLRIGAVATLSRNFQENFIKPLLALPDVTLVLQSGSLDELLTRLSIHNIDLVLSNRRVHSDVSHPWRCRRIARQPVSLVGKKRARGKAFRFPKELADVPLLLPSRDSDIRAGFDLLCDQLGIQCHVRAEVDDMAMLRLLARDAAQDSTEESNSVALLPTVVVQDELRSGRLQEYCVVPQLYENFYAITVQRHFEPPLLKMLLKRTEADVLGLSVAS